MKDARLGESIQTHASEHSTRNQKVVSPMRSRLLKVFIRPLRCRHSHWDDLPRGVCEFFVAELERVLFLARFRKSHDFRYAILHSVTVHRAFNRETKLFRRSHSGQPLTGLQSLAREWVSDHAQSLTADPQLLTPRRAATAVVILAERG